MTNFNTNIDALWESTINQGGHGFCGSLKIVDSHTLVKHSFYPQTNKDRCFSYRRNY
jgi:hypothetical protein